MRARLDSGERCFSVDARRMRPVSEMLRSLCGPLAEEEPAEEEPAEEEPAEEERGGVVAPFEDRADRADRADAAEAPLVDAASEEDDDDDDAADDDIWSP